MFKAHALSTSPYDVDGIPLDAFKILFNVMKQDPETFQVSRFQLARCHWQAITATYHIIQMYETMAMQLKNKKRPLATLSVADFEAAGLPPVGASLTVAAA